MKSILIFLLIFFISAFSMFAQVTNLHFKAEADIAGLLSLQVQLSNARNGSLDTISWGTIIPGPAGSKPFVAKNAANNPTYAKIIYGINYSGWDLRVYTRNHLGSAHPQYVGDLNLAKDLGPNKGNGLIFDNGTGTNSRSIPMRVWSDAKFPTTGEFARAQCLQWIGTGGAGSPWKGVPVPHDINHLYYAINGEDLNNDTYINGSTGSTPINTNSNKFWTERGGSGPAYDIHRPIDINGDGDTNDTLIGVGGKVFENGWWLGVVASDDDVAGAYTAVLDNSGIANGPRVAGSVCRAYFTITDEIAGSYKTDQLYFELKVR